MIFAAAAALARAYTVTRVPACATYGSYSFCAEIHWVRARSAGSYRHT
jgi:hypothetical protein